MLSTRDSYAAEWLPKYYYFAVNGFQLGDVGTVAQKERRCEIRAAAV